MNAYELAEAMDTKGFRYREVKAAVKMLRQQADRIAELEEELENQQRISRHEHIVAENALKQVKELEKQSEPACWLEKGDGTRLALYTTQQTKPSDAEYERLIKQRDSYHEWADRLASAISEHFDYEIGEHSSANCPWTNAMVCIESPQDLYITPQTKLLSDEKILEVAKKKGWSGDLGFLIDFARAIEAKVRGEK